MAQGVNNRAHMTSSYRSPVISVGSLALGGDNPIRIQSMTNTDTNDTNASTEQCIRIIEAGADLVRLTAQGVKEAENLKNIKIYICLVIFLLKLINQNIKILNMLF